MKAPVPHPALAVQVAGQDAPAAWLRLLVDVKVRQRLGMPSVCEMTFLDAEGLLDDTALTRVGSELKISLADTGALLFCGDITGLAYVYQSAYGRELRVRAYDRLGRLARRQKLRNLTRTNVTEVVRELTSDLAVEVACDAPDLPLDHVIQHEQTDLQFLNGITERAGLYAFLAGDVLQLISLAGSGGVELALGRELFEARFTRNGMSDCESVTTRGWNSWLAEAHTGEAGGGPGGTIRQGALPSLRAFLVNRAFASDAEAERASRAELEFRAACASCIAGVASGDPRLRPGARVTVKGVAAALEGPYVLSAVNHSIGAESGFVSEIESMPERPPMRSHSMSMTLGNVCRTEDPQALGRVQLMLPALGDLTTDWVQTVSPWAGAGKGFMSQADIGDTVLFAYFGADPAHGVVLGSVYGNGGPPEDWARTMSGQCYAIITPGGHKIRLDDSKGSARIQSGDGSYIDLSPSATVLHSRAALRIEAPGQPLVLRARTIDLERG
ncbi:hypothetical protein CR51_36255 [Caballeronia megalochromosomata]|jgi:uncharacterized protein involved in type VI secretion and phage assembly|nr:hypothetical protein CR51_36255 [Caballeronia megalochromosomata]